MSSRQLSGDSLQAAAPAPAHNRSPSGSMSGVREDGAAGSPPAASSAETKVRKVSHIGINGVSVFHFDDRAVTNHET